MTSLSISGKTRLIALLGSPVSHSRSPALQNGAFLALGLDYVYLAFDIPLERVTDAIQALRVLNARGANVTMPLKQAVCEHLDRLSPTAALAGAVNTIVNDDGVLAGHMTDGAGYLMSLDECRVPYIGKTMTILGAGGAATAVAVEAAMRGVRSVHLFNRRDAFFEAAQVRVMQLRERLGCDAQLHDLDDANDLAASIKTSDILVNATSIGMEATRDQCLIQDPGCFHAALTVSDLIYVPAETALLKMARARGCRTVDGTGMQRLQGMLSFQLWTGQDLPADLARQSLAVSE